MKKNNLHNIKDSGFKTPNYYFEYLEDTILNEVKLKENIESHNTDVPDNYFDDLEDIILSKVKLNEKVSTPGFETPTDYFTTLEDSIISKIEIEQSPKVVPLFNKKNILYASSIAAAIVLFFRLSIIPGSDIKEPSISDIDTELIDSYVLDETQATDLASLFTETELDETSFINYNLSDDTLDSYLEDLDENELILQ